MSLPLARPVEPSDRGQAFGLAALAAVGIVAIAACVGNPTRATITVLGLGIAVAAAVAISARPFAGYLLMIGSSIALVVVTVLPGRAVNAFDALLLPVLAGTWWGRARTEAHASDATERGAAHDEIRRAGRGLASATIAFYVAAGLSLVQTVLMGNPEGAFNSALHLIRAVQGLLIFPIGLIWLRSESQVRAVIGTVLIGVALLALGNTAVIVAGDFHRAGMTWFANEPELSLTDPNEAATAMILVWGLLLARQATTPSFANLALMPVVLALLVLTQSRSGLLSWTVFSVISLRRAHWGYLVGLAVLVIGAVPLLPGHYIERISRTLVFERGSFEAYSSLTRIYSWRAAWDVFREHPFFGVGYLGFRHFSHGYNELRAVLTTAENLFLEVASGMGIVGLVLLGLVLGRMIQLGRVVRRTAPRGTFAYHMAGLHLPFVASLMVAGLTGDNLFGMVGLAQLALWNVLLLRSGHVALARFPMDMSAAGVRP